MGYLKFCIRFSYHFTLFLLTFPLLVFGCIVLLCVLPMTKTYVPKCLKWFDCADHYIGRDTSSIDAIVSQGWFNYYKFIALRNPLNYFSYVELGVDSSDLVLAINGLEVGDTLRPGFYYVEGIDKGLNVKAYEYDYIYKWSQTRCFRFRMGWKLSGLGTGRIAEEVFVISPFHSYTGV